MFKSTAENRLGKKKELRLMTFIIGLFTAAAIFIPFIVNDKGYFIFFGDFNVQQIPFYQHCHEMVRSGNFGWDWQTELGASFVGSYSFYLLGSPFFWLTLPFPNWMVPYLMGPLLILKFALASLTAYMFIRRFTARPETAMAGGLMYAFSGFSVYNIFFNHFHEAIVFFPLLLLAIERFMAERTRGAVIFAVFICALTNYYFFFGMVLFVIIYWIVRMLSHSFKILWSDFLLLMLECVLGLLLAAGLLLPSVMEVMQNSRLSSMMSGWGGVLYGKEQIFLNVIECFFFPPDLPARPVFFPGADVKWSSLGGWLPLFGMTGVIAWLQSHKKGTWLRRSMVIFITMALIPILNSAFSMFNTAYYARWYYMPILLMCLATALAIEDTEVNWSSAWRWSAGITVAFVAVIGFMPTVEDGRIVRWGLYTNARTNPIKYIYQTILHAIDPSVRVEGDMYDERFWITCLFAVLSVIVVRLMLPQLIKKKTMVLKTSIAALCCVSVLYSVYFINCGQSHSYERDEVMTDALIEGKVSIADEEEFSRVDVYDGVDNTGLYLGLSSINFFHSIVPASVTDFYSFVGTERSVATRLDKKYYALRPFLSVKYMLDPIIDGSKVFCDSEGTTQLPNYSLYSEECGYKIYRNENYIPMGFTYDYYMTEKQAVSKGNDRVQNMMLKAVLLEKEDIPILKQYLDNIGEQYIMPEDSTGKMPLLFDYDTVASDSAERAEVSAHYFKETSDGFKAYISMDRDNLVFFSVPYHDGWTAKVNGQEAEIYRVNKGFMAVVAPEGLCEIVFEFETPGLKIGLIISIISAVLAAIYIGFVYIKRSMSPVTPPEYPEGDVIAEHIRRYEGANYAAENPEDDYLLDNIDRDNIDAYVGFNGGFVINEAAINEVNNMKNTAEVLDEQDSVVIDSVINYGDDDQLISLAANEGNAEKSEPEPAKGETQEAESITDTDESVDEDSEDEPKKD